jgi:hypothetical protein
MKIIRRLFAAGVLALALSTHALAGEISTTVVQPPPPPGEIETPAAGEISTPGEMHTGAPGQIDTSGGGATAAVLSLLQTALSLL